MVNSRVNGDVDLPELEPFRFVPSGPEGDPEALWGRCPKCSLRALKVESTVPYAAQCVRCGHCPTFTELLPEASSPKHEFSDWLKPMAAMAAEVEPEAVDWLVEGLLPGDGISLLVAPPKVGKSTAARCLAAAVAGGDTNWIGRPLAI